MQLSLFLLLLAVGWAQARATIATTMKPAIKATNLPVVGCGKTEKLDKRIAGGSEAKKGQFPWMVSLRDESKNGQHQCGGSIINRQWILTAAHCFKWTRNPSLWTVVAGEHDASDADEGHEVQVGVNRIFLHNYDKLTKVNDVALMLLDEPLPDRDDPEDNHVDKDDWINEICLPTTDDVARVGDVCHVMGWGALNYDGVASDILEEVTIPILDLNNCTEKYERNIIDNSQICAGHLEGGMDTCQGDSGGPLACQRSDGTFYIAGLTSYGFPYCAAKGWPGVYTKTAAHLAWIRDTMEANTEA